MIGGTYQAPRVRLPGAGGAPEIATAAKAVAVILKHSRRAFVETLDFVTSSGHMDSDSANRNLARHGRGPTIVITDLGILTPDPVTRELTLTSLHPGVAVEKVVENTGWPLKAAPKLLLANSVTMPMNPQSFTKPQSPLQQQRNPEYLSTG